MVRKIRKATREAGLTWDLEREGGRHSIYSLDGLRIPIGRHPGEVGNRYAEMVYRQCEPKLGKGWWR
ncbi:hypothetical protein AXK60_18660 [Tsukamurella pseudospumae]|uniref:Toxin HicA n=1 Tax=Tsukamurella pseudospumae TaxID=239498 RepID=A0A138A041_9ACTN|nr:hypothetical protein AXK61_10705 [Tsukamurella pseudospumae]KXP03804.1 hypothetical protein AXK60_18660 [Tsukamurella pseudospumae]